MIPKAENPLQRELRGIIPPRRIVVVRRGCRTNLRSNVPSPRPRSSTTTSARFTHLPLYHLPLTDSCARRGRRATHPRRACSPMAQSASLRKLTVSSPLDLSADLVARPPEEANRRTTPRRRFDPLNLPNAVSGQKRCPAPGFHLKLGINSGNDLLSHKLDKHYHRRCGVSLPCSGWERVGPPRKDHQTMEISDHCLRLPGVWRPESFKEQSELSFRRRRGFPPRQRALTTAYSGKPRNSNDLNLHEADRRIKKAERTLVVLS